MIPGLLRLPCKRMHRGSCRRGLSDAELEEVNAGIYAFLLRKPPHPSQ